MVDDDGTRVVREERHLGGVTGCGEVRLVTGEAQGPAHGRVAAAKAWLAVAQHATDAGDAATGYEAARRGVEELGEDYADASLEDDTSLKLAAAQHAHEAGATYAHTAMTRVLEDRIAVFETRADRTG